MCQDVDLRNPHMNVWINHGYTGMICVELHEELAIELAENDL